MSDLGEPVIGGLQKFLERAKETLYISSTLLFVFILYNKCINGSLSLSPVNHLSKLMQHGLGCLNLSFFLIGRMSRSLLFVTDISDSL